MRFLFVDKISRISAFEIEGQVTFSSKSPFFLKIGQKKFAHPGLVSEAIGQLASWKLMKDHNFQFRPLYLFSDMIKNLSSVELGATINLRATISPDQDSGSITFSGEASLEGQTVQILENCTTYLFPIEELDSSTRLADSFAKLTGSNNSPLLDESAGFDFGPVFKSKKEVATDCWNAQCEFPSNASFYADHFPRRPITPIVLINELISQLSHELLGERKKEFILFPSEVKRVVIKSFISPEEGFFLKVTKLDELASHQARESIAVGAEITKKNKIILRGQFLFDLKADDSCC